MLSRGRPVGKFPCERVLCEDVEIMVLLSACQPAPPPCTPYLRLPTPSWPICARSEVCSLPPSLIVLALNTSPARPLHTHPYAQHMLGRCMSALPNPTSPLTPDSNPTCALPRAPFTLLPSPYPLQVTIPEKYVLMSEPDHVWLKPMPNLMRGEHPGGHACG